MAFEIKSIDVGSNTNLDEYCGYGTAFHNPDEFKLDMSDRIHMLGAGSSPFLSWMQKVRVKTATQVFFSWMESELFTQRDIKCTLIRSTAHGSGGYVYALKLDTAADWMAFAAAAKKDEWAAGEYKPLIYLTVIKASDTTKKYSAVIEKPALTLGQTQRTVYWEADGTASSLAGVLNTITLYDTGNGQTKIGGAGDEVSAVPSDVVATGDFATFAASFATATTDVYVSVTTPNDFLKGYAQGSGLPTESRRTSRSLKNFVQIFKTPYSVSNTQKAISAAGGTYGGDELARLRLAKGIEHKIDIETAIMFQGGGVEGTDWGELPAVSGDDGENPLTRLKGLGIGLAMNGLTTKPGFIQTKNADLDTRYVFANNAATMTELNRLMGLVFDDTVDNPSTAKTLFCSQKWLASLADIGLQNTSGVGIYTFGERMAAPGELGIIIRSIMTPVGRLDCVHLPRLRGKYENYAFVADMANMEWRPLVLRNTMLNADTGEKTRDGQLDYFITEGGFECRHESTHAVLKLAV
jgi:hypothetical protein